MIECNAIKEQRTANRRLVKKRVQCLLGVLCFVLSAEQYSSRQDFITKSIQDSYKVLENKIIEFPTQWTSWLTIQNLFLRDYSTPFDKNYVPKNKFNDDRYTLFVVNNSCFLFDLFDYQSYPIEKNLSESLKQNDFTKINPKLQLELKQKNIII